MTNLSDNEIKRAIHEWDMPAGRGMQVLVQAAKELIEMRAAQRADAARVRSAVEQIVLEVICEADDEPRGDVLAGRIADHVAAKLAPATPVLSAEERAGLQAIHDEIAETWNLEPISGMPDNKRWEGVRRGFAALDRLLGGDPMTTHCRAVGPQSRVP